MENNKDVQRDFYENGYKKPGLSPSEVIAGFTRLDSSTRISRAKEMIYGCQGGILDVGCGSGPLLYEVRGQFRKMYGVDIADAQLDQARMWSREMRIDLELIRCNIDSEPLRLPNSSIDVVCCLVVLDFIIRPDLALLEIHRVLKPGGVFVASVGNIVSWKNRLRVLVGLDPRTTVFMNAINGGALHHFTQKTFTVALEKSGFVVEKIGCSGRLWPVRRYWPSLLGGDIIVRAKKVEG